MLTTSKKPAFQYLKKLMVLPLIAVAATLFAFTYKREIKNVADEKLKNIKSVFTEAISELPLMKDTIPNDTLQKEKALYLFDGKEIAKGDAKKITPDKIKTIAVLKSKMAIKKYGNKGKYGAIEMYSKEDAVVSESPTNNKAKMGLPEVVVIGYGKVEDMVDSKDQPAMVAPFSLPKDKDPVFTVVETPASYNGGEFGWRNFLERNLRGNAPIEHAAKEGAYKVAVQFIVEKDGNLTNIKALTNQGFGMEAEAIRVISKSNKWAPATQNGHEVRSIYRQDITFQVIQKKETTNSTVAVDNINEPEIFTKVQREAEYPATQTGAWQNFLARNLNGNIPKENGAPAGNYTAIVQFIVDTDGSISDVKAIKDPGFGMGTEATRVIKKSGKWKPAVQNNRIVKAYRKQPITFQLN